jgi:hypothetical protein
MTICRTTDFGGIPGASALAADMTRIDSPFPGGAPAPSRRARPGYRVPAAARRAQPPDLGLLQRVRDGLMKL